GRQIFAALDVTAKLGGDTIESAGKVIERGGESGAQPCRRIGKLAGLITQHEPNFAEQWSDSGSDLGKLGDVTRSRSRRDFGVARKVGELPRAYLLAEKQRSGIGQLMRFVEDDRIARRQQLGESLVAQHDIGEEEVMVD